MHDIKVINKEEYEDGTKSKDNIVITYTYKNVDEMNECKMIETISFPKKELTNLIEKLSEYV